MDITKNLRRARAARLREARKRASRPPQWMRRNNPVAPALARNGSRKCTVKGCSERRYGLGRYCAAHASNLRQTGHPVGRNLRRADWRPLIREAEAFISAQVRAEHPAIMAALRWLHEELARAKHPTTHDRVHLWYAEALLRAHRHGVDATAFLVRWIAGELADDRGIEPGPRYADDVHAAHQRARMFLFARPFGDQRNTWARRKRSAGPTTPAVRIPWSVRAYTFDRLNSVLGVLAIRAADEIRRQRCGPAYSHAILTT